MNRIYHWLVVVGLMASVGVATASEPAPADPPIDPFDYSFCGGKPVYPVIGFNFATFCGPRNQVALGRRGKLMWSYPTQEGEAGARRGYRQLSESELARLTLLAEAAQLAPPPAYATDAVVYDLGIDFQGRPYHRIHGSLANRGSSANVLLEAMRALVAEAPLLPACENAPADFDPTLVPEQRRARPLAASSPPREEALVGRHGLVVEPPRPIVVTDLIDHHGRPARLPAEDGRWQLVAFGYTHCPDVCPMTLHKVAQALARLGGHAQRIQPLFVSVDAGRDDAARMKSFVEAFDARILGLVGEAEALVSAANAFGVLTRRHQGKTALAYALAHSSLLYVVDPQGRVRHLFAADLTPDAMAADLARWLDSEPAVATAGSW